MILNQPLLMIGLFCICFNFTSFSYTAEEWYEQGEVYHQQSNSDSAYHCYAQAADLYLKIKHWQRYFESVYREQVFLCRLDRPEDAIRILKEAQAIAASRGQGDHPFQFLIHSGLAGSYSLIREPILGIEQGKIAMTMLDAIEDELYHAEFYNNLGSGYQVAWNIDSALYYYQLAEEIVLRYPVRYLTRFTVYLNLAGAYQTNGRFDKAEPIYQDAYQYLDEEKEVTSLSTYYTNQSIMYDDMGEHNRSLELNHNALRILDKAGLPNDFFYGVAYHNLAGTYRTIGMMDSALYYNEKELEIFGKRFGMQSMTVATLLTSIAICQNQLGQHERALSTLREVNKIRSKKFPPLSLVNANTYSHLGPTFWNLHQADSTLFYIEKALAIRKKLQGPKHGDLSLSYLKLCHYYDEQDDYNKALRYLDSSMYSNYFGTNMANYLESSSAQDWMNLDHLFNSLSKKVVLLLRTCPDQADSMACLKETLVFNTQALALAQKMRQEMPDSKDRLVLNKQVLPLSEQAIDLAYRLYQLSKDESFIHTAYQVNQQSKSILLTDALKHRQVLKNAGIPDSLVQKEMDLNVAIVDCQRKIRKAAKNQGQALTNTREEMFQLRQEQAKLLELLQSSYPAYYKTQKQMEFTSLESIQTNMKPDAAILEYFMGPERSFAFLITSDTAMCFPIDDIEMLHNTFLEYQQHLVHYDPDKAMDRASFQTFVDQGWTLYHGLFPAQWHIAGITDLAIVPDGWLHYLPFETLLSQQVEVGGPDYSSLPYLVKEYSIHYQHMADQNALLLRKDSSSANTVSYLGMAPSFEATTETGTQQAWATRNVLQPLKGNMLEVEAVQAILKGTVYFRSDASKQHFMEEAPKHPIIHLATHAVIDDKEPLYSTLIFSTDHQDHQLHLFELLNMEIPGELAVLSACHSGGGKLSKGEGIISLGRAFAYTGCSSVMPSLWAVHDMVAADLVPEFFEHLADGDDKAMALTKAKRQYLSSADQVTAHPYFWANLVLIGDAAPLSSARRAYMPVWGWIFLAVAAMMFGGYVFWRRKKASI